MQTNYPITTLATNKEYPSINLIKNSKHHYLFIAAEIDKTIFPFYWKSSKPKKKLISYCKETLNNSTRRTSMIDFAIFDAILIPPGRGKFIVQNVKASEYARFDVVILLEFDRLEDVENFKKQRTYINVIATIKEIATKTETIIASNVKRMGPVNSKKKGVFLFNYFFANQTEQCLNVWEYTARWFATETKLDNSTLLLPITKSKHTLINHCRWDSLSDILPHLLFKPSFKNYVLDTFYRNDVGAQPILYKLIL